MKKSVELRKAKPEDLKIDRKRYRIGQPFCVCTNDDENVNGIYVLKGDEDPYILKRYLDEGQLFVPENDEHFMNWIKEDENEEINIQSH